MLSAEGKTGLIYEPDSGKEDTRKPRRERKRECEPDGKEKQRGKYVVVDAD